MTTTDTDSLRLETLHAEQERLRTQIEDLYAEQNELKARVASLRDQLSFYASFDTLLYDGYQAQIADAMETARAITEKARAEAEQIIEEAEAERDRILREARARATTIRREADSETPARDEQKSQPPEVSPSIASDRNGDGVEIVVAGFENFSQIISFQNALRKLPQTQRVRVKQAYEGRLSMTVQHPSQSELARNIATLAGFDVELTQQQSGLLCFTLEHENGAIEAESVPANTHAHRKAT